MRKWLVVGIAIFVAALAGASVYYRPSDPALKAALDHAFEEPAAPPFRRTKAVVVVHDSKVIAERYAAGVGIDTPLRLGDSVDPTGDIRGLGRLVKEVIAAVQP